MCSAFCSATRSDIPLKKKGKATADFTDGAVVAKPTKQMPPQIQEKGKASSPYKMPPPLPCGTVLESQSDKSKWITGQSIGKGGFGEIYLAAPGGKSAAEKDARCVVKMVRSCTSFVDFLIPLLPRHSFEIMAWHFIPL